MFNSEESFDGTKTRLSTNNFNHRFFSSFFAVCRRSLDGDRVVRELGPRVSNVIATRRQALVEARQGGGAASREGDAESAEFELGLWSEWENLTGPPQ